MHPTLLSILVSRSTYVPLCPQPRQTTSLAPNNYEMDGTSLFHNMSNEILPYILLYQVLMNTDTGPSNKTFSLSVVVNSGWCKDEMSAHWVKDGDYVSLKASEIVISNDKMNYEKDIHVSQM